MPSKLPESSLRPTLFNSPSPKTVNSDGASSVGDFGDIVLTPREKGASAETLRAVQKFFNPNALPTLPIGLFRL